MKKIMIVHLLTLLSFSSLAQWQGGVQLGRMSDDGIDMNMVTASANYDFAPEQQFHWLAGARVGVGLSGETIDSYYGEDIKGELDSLFAFDVRGQYESTEQVYLFTTISYILVKVTASLWGHSVSESENETGVGLGLGYRITDRNSLEMSYQTFDGTDVVSLGLNWRF